MHIRDEKNTLIEPKEGGFETCGGEDVRRPFVAILAKLGALFGYKPCKPNLTTSQYSPTVFFILIGATLSTSLSFLHITSSSPLPLSTEE